MPASRTRAVLSLLKPGFFNFSGIPFRYPPTSCTASPRKCPSPCGWNIAAMSAYQMFKC